MSEIFIHIAEGLNLHIPEGLNLHIPERFNLHTPQDVNLHHHCYQNGLSKRKHLQHHKKKCKHRDILSGGPANVMKKTNVKLRVMESADKMSSCQHWFY